MKLKRLLAVFMALMLVFSTAGGALAANKTSVKDAKTKPTLKITVPKEGIETGTYGEITINASVPGFITINLLDSNGTSVLKIAENAEIHSKDNEYEVMAFSDLGYALEAGTYTISATMVSQYGTESKETTKDLKITAPAADATATPTPIPGTTGNTAVAQNGTAAGAAYNPYGTTATGTTGAYNPYGTTATGTTGAYNPYGTTATGTTSAYNPYGTTTSGTTGAYNPYGTTTSGTTSAYNPYGTTTSGTTSAYNPYGTTTSSSTTGSTYNPYGTTTTGTTNAYGTTTSGTTSSSGSYDPYAYNSSSTGTTATSGTYNPYGTTTSGTTTSSSSYDPYAYNSSSTGTTSTGSTSSSTYNPYGTTSTGTTTSGTSTYNAYGTTTTSGTSAYDPYGTSSTTGTSTSTYNPYGTTSTSGTSTYDPYGTSTTTGSSTSTYNPYGASTTTGSTTSTYNPYGTTSTSGTSTYDPYGTSSTTGSSTYNPYGTTSTSGSTYDPYGTSTTTGSSTYNPYGTTSTSGTSTYDPYGTSTGTTSTYNPYGTTTTTSTYDPYGTSTGTTSTYNPYGTTSASGTSTYNPYGTTSSTYDPYGIGGTSTSTYDPYGIGGTSTSTYDPYGIGGTSTYDPYGIGGTTTYDPYSMGGTTAYDPYATQYDPTQQAAAATAAVPTVVTYRSSGGFLSIGEEGYQIGVGVSDVYPQTETSFWNLPANPSDADIWAALTRPITYVNVSDQETAAIYDSPHDGRTKLGSVAGSSQGLNILNSRSDGWSLVEAYRNEDGAFMRGYIKTNKLKLSDVSTTYGIVVDKRSQMLLVYMNGQRVGSCLVCTGVPTVDYLKRETVAGEFKIATRRGTIEYVGRQKGFSRYAIRINNNIYLQEIPTTKRNGSDYSIMESYLGSKQTRGTICVQARASADGGINAEWIWKMTENTRNLKVLVIDDKNRDLIPVGK